MVSEGYQINRFSTKNRIIDCRCARTINFRIILY